MSFINKLFDVSNKTVVVTGASRGIGFAIAKGFSQAGAKVIGVSRSTPEDVSIFEKYLALDLGSREDIKKLTSAVESIDVLVNAAGITMPHDTDDIQLLEEAFDKTINVNLKSSFVLIENFKKSLIENKGSVINITSIGQATGFPNNPSYLASKGGLAQLTKGFAYDLGKAGVRVNNIAPGYIHTEMTEKSFSDKEKYQERLRNMLIERWGEPEDIMGAALFLASPAASYITGETLFVDGGWMAKGMV